MDDAALVAAARSGDRKAWGLIYDRYADRLHDHCWSILRDEHEAGDALQDAFVKAAGAIGQLRDPSRLRPWLYAIARNEAYRRHRARSRVVPTEDLGADDGEFGTVSVDLEHDAGSPVEDLRKLVWDAAAGLSADDQALLDLHLRQGLEGEELAEAMGITANNAYVKLSRLRDTLERSLGALLVARTGSRDCEELAALLAGWDGAMSPLLRKRVARHVDGCEICGDRKKAMVSPLALLAGVPLLPAPAALRERILDATTTAAASAPPAPAEPTVPTAPTGPTGPPPPPATTGRSPWPWVAGAVAALLVVLVAVLLAVGGDDDPEEVASEQSTTTEAEATTSTSSTSSTSTSSTSSTSTSSTTSTTLPVALPGAISLTAADIDLGTTATQGVFRIANTGGSPVSYVLTTTNALVRATPITGTIEPGSRTTITVRFDRAGAPGGPFQHGVHVDAGPAGAADAIVRGTVPANPPVITGVSSSEADMQTTCNPANSTTTITATFTDASAVTATLSWTSPTNGPGSKPMGVAGGSASATLGPFALPDPSLTYVVTVTDAFGASTTSSPQTIEVLPCPG
jgi:RNA polymerase sigma factor (sigma-70 family)